MKSLKADRCKLENSLSELENDIHQLEAQKNEYLDRVELLRKDIATLDKEGSQLSRNKDKEEKKDIEKSEENNLEKDKSKNTEEIQLTLGVDEESTSVKKNNPSIDNN